MLSHLPLQTAAVAPRARIMQAWVQEMSWFAPVPDADPSAAQLQPRSSVSAVPQLQTGRWRWCCWCLFLQAAATGLTWGKGGGGGTCRSPSEYIATHRRPPGRWTSPSLRGRLSA